MIRLVTDPIEVRKERIFQIIRENPGKGFNQLWEITKKRGKNGICARMTFKKIIEDLETEERIEKIKDGKQRYQYLVLEGDIAIDKNYSDSLKKRLELIKKTHGFLLENITKVEQLEKEAIMEICFNTITEIILDAQTRDVIIKNTDGPKHDNFKNILINANKFRDEMIHDSMLIYDGTGGMGIPDFYNYFQEGYHRRNKKLFIQLLKQIPKNHLKIWSDRFFKNNEFLQ